MEIKGVNITSKHMLLRLCWKDEGKIPVVFVGNCVCLCCIWFRGKLSVK